MDRPETLKYSGSIAEGYDDKRSKSPRWKNEVSVFSEWLDRIRPASVLDCPFGTGRWIQQYDGVGASVIGVDISDDMLNEARAKIENHAAYSLVSGSLFEVDFSEFSVDLLVCIRLLNWLPYAKALQAIENLGKAKAPTLIVGCSVRPEDASPMSRLLMQAFLKAGNVSRKRDLQYVLDESAFLKDMGALSWKLMERKFIFKNSSRYNYFYWFARD